MKDPAAPGSDDAWPPWPAGRGLTKAEYRDQVEARLGKYHLGVFDFHSDDHLTYIVAAWEDFELAIDGFCALCFVKTVDWGTLDAPTQEALTCWRPKPGSI